MKNLYVLFITLFSVILLHAQDISRFNCEVKIDDKILPSPFTGGLNSPQFSKMDVNLDNLEDLIVFDRVGNRLNVFINNQNNIGHYIFMPQYNDIFPNIHDWMLLADYNNDGIKDLFTAGENTDIEVWKGKIINSEIVFSKYINPYKNNYFQRDVLSTRIQGNYDVRLEHLASDIPALVDIDNDGDIDILTFGGGGTIDFHKNICVEKQISNDSFKLILSQSCWGRFRESNDSNIIELSDNKYRCAGSTSIELRHAGSSSLILDMDDDGDYDILIGDAGYDSLIYLENGGNETNAWMTKMDRVFPKNGAQIALKTFLAPFNVDVDEDGKKDLIVAPNVIEDYYSQPQNIQNIYYYRNTGYNNGSKFTFVKNDFLIEDMIDLGGRVYPTFVDVDADGLIDIIAGTGPRITFDKTSSSTLYFFKNIGSKENPKFKLIDKDYLNLSEISEDYELNYFTPSFGDLDGDNDLDLLIGNNTGTLIYLENIAGENNILKFKKPILNYKGLTTLDFSAPCIFDFNNDNMGDILLGVGFNFHDNINSYGAAVYFENIGDSEADFNNDPFINPNSGFFGKLLYDDESLFNSNAFFSTYKSKDKEFLFSGSVSGKINIYTDFTKYKNKELIPLYKDYGNIDIGQNSSPAVADIDNDGYLEMLIGTSRGGFEFWNTDIKIKDKVNTIDEDISMHAKIYPNPTNSIITIEIDKMIGEGIKYKLTDLYGKTIKKGSISRRYNNINLKKFNEGLYFLTLQTDKNTFCKKIIKTNN